MILAPQLFKNLFLRSFLYKYKINQIWRISKTLEFHLNKIGTIHIPNDTYKCPMSEDFNP